MATLLGIPDWLFAVLFLLMFVAFGGILLVAEEAYYRRQPEKERPEPSMYP